jgi:hypothetical protein
VRNIRLDFPAAPRPTQSAANHAEASRSHSWAQPGRLPPRRAGPGP